MADPGFQPDAPGGGFQDSGFQTIAGTVAGDFWTTDTNLFWQLVSPNWRPWPGELLVSAQAYEFRWCAPGPGEACLFDPLLAQYDVEDIIEFIDDVNLPATPVRLPVKEIYREIRNVQLTIVQAASEPPRVVDVLDKSITGPLVRSRFTDGTPTTATVDAIIRGY